jgi:hypothetical protein
VCRFWHQSPLWFYSLSKDLQIRLIADYRLFHGKPKNNKTSISRNELAERIAKYQRKGMK